MHELSIAQSILEIVEGHLPPGNSAPVTTVRLRIGRLSGVVTESLEFCFSAITAGTAVEGARLEIEHVPISIQCDACGSRSEVKEQSFLCPSCGSGHVRVVTGTELQVAELELADKEGTSP